MSAGSNPQPSILFLQKLDEEEAKELNETDYPIFMAAVNKVGYDLTTKTAPIIFSKDEKGELLKDENGKPIIDTDIPYVIEAFRAFRTDHQILFRKSEVI